jgi:PAP2 superfamily
MRRDRTWSSAGRAAAPIALALALCPLVAALAPGRAEPLARIRALIGDERSLGLFFEPGAHRWAAARPVILHLADFGYIAIHLPVTLGVLAWVWLARPLAFGRVRLTFVAIQLLAVAGYLLVPTAPPRMVAGLGYGDAMSAGQHGLARLVQSPYAAMPSEHVAFALFAAGTVVLLTRSRPVRVAAVLYPLLVLAEIVVTGNHIWLDAVAGAGVAAAGASIAWAIRQLRAPAPVVAIPAVD